MIRRAEQTALDEVKSGNRRVAGRAASRLAAYVNEETRLLQTIGASLGPAVHARAEQSERILKNYRITFTELRELDFVGMEPDCMEVATSRLDGKTRPRCDAPGVKK